MKNLLSFILLFVLVSCGKEEPVVASSEKNIVSFTINGTNAAVSSSTVSLVLDVDLLDGLRPSIVVSDKATISPASDVPQDFSVPVEYTVTAEDGTTKMYTVTVQTLIHEFTHNKKIYEIVRSRKSWIKAAEYAVAKGGYLVEINDKEEQDAIYAELVDVAKIEPFKTQNAFNRGAVWLGGHDTMEEGTWIWDGNNDGIGTQFWEGGIDGKRVNDSYTNWGNEPDNSGNQDYLSIAIETTPRNAKSQWNDLDSGNNSLYFVIEYD